MEESPEQDSWKSTVRFAHFGNGFELWIGCLGC